MRRAEDPLSDYRNGPQHLYNVFWDLFPLGTGLGTEDVITKAAYRRIFLHHSNRFATQHQLLAVVSDTMLRLEVNRCVYHRTKQSGKLFEDFVERVNSPTFAAELEEAERNPEGKTALRLAREVTRFITLSGNNIVRSHLL